MEYEYKCASCGTKFSMVGSFTTLTSGIPSCPNCKQSGVYRVYTIPSFILRGTGWSKTTNEPK